MEKIKRTFKELASPYLIVIRHLTWEFALFFILLTLFLNSTLSHFWDFILMTNIVDLNEKNIIPNIIIFIILSIFSLLGYLYYWAIHHNKKITKIIVIVCVIIIQTCILGIKINIRFNDSAREIYNIHPHDGITQTEVAMDFFLHGKNPYQENYYNTALDNEIDHTLIIKSVKKKWAIVNPALESYVYMPLNFILPIPLKYIFEEIFHFYDNRIFNFIFYLLSCLLVYKLTNTTKKNNYLFIFFCLNPFIYEDLIFGYSDITPIYFLLLAYFFLRKEKYFLSVISITIGALIKQNIVFFWPFFLIYILFKKYLPITKKSIMKFIRYPLVMLFMICVVLLPFILWNPEAFYHDTIYYLGHIYPARGMGLAGLLLQLKVIGSPFEYYNFAIWQIIFIMVFFPLFLHRQYKNNTPKNAYLHGTLLMGGVWFLARYFTDSHFDVVLTNLLIILFL